MCIILITSATILRSINVACIHIKHHKPIARERKKERPMSTCEPEPVALHVQDRHVVLDNGLLQVTLSRPEGMITAVRYNGVDNVMAVHNHEGDRGYWDLVWNNPGENYSFYRIEGTKFKIVAEEDDRVEVSFQRTWDVSHTGSVVPLNIDKRYIMLQGSSGFYAYGIYEHKEGWPDFDLPEARIVFKLNKDKFHYMAISDNRQRIMPMPEDRSPHRSKELAYPEAVLLVDPIDKNLAGEVDDKYQYSMDDKDNNVHGWICTDPPIGFWAITPSDEFRTGGPLKQDLTSHTGPITLAMFVSRHYAGDDQKPTFRNGEYWKKVFGPIFVYLNSTQEETNPEEELWMDAKSRMQDEISSWPYGFPASEDFCKEEERGSVTGRLLVRDRFMMDSDMPALGSYVGLALPGDAGSWQRECKGYQFWRTTDDNGYFEITNVIAGVYNLYAFVNGIIGDYKYEETINVSSGCAIDLGEIVFEPPRDGPTLWEIGIPDRSAAEFFIPDPDPRYINRLYVNHPDKFRQYGLWERYTEMYPDEDLVYTIGESDFTKDWFFAHVTRKTQNSKKPYSPATWKINFSTDSVQEGTYKLCIAIASAMNAELQVRIGDPTANPPHFTSGLIGHDNAIQRHGIRGQYRLFQIDISNSLLKEGANTIFLTQARSPNPFAGILYDYIRLEGPQQEANDIKFLRKFPLLL